MQIAGFFIGHSFLKYPSIYEETIQFQTELPKFVSPTKQIPPFQWQKNLT